MILFYVKKIGFLYVKKIDLNIKNLIFYMKIDIIMLDYDQ